MLSEFNGILRDYEDYRKRLTDKTVSYPLASVQYDLDSAKLLDHCVFRAAVGLFIPN
jgi:hypothetical protein